MNRCLAIFLLWLSLPAHAALNKWVDSEGNTHYSDSAAPAGTQSQQVETLHAASGAPAIKSIAEQEAEWKKSQKAKADAAQKEEEQQQTRLAREKNCATARGNITLLEKSPRIASYDANGNPVPMDDATRQKNLEENRKAAAEYCD